MLSCKCFASGALGPGGGVTVIVEVGMDSAPSLRTRCQDGQNCGWRLREPRAQAGRGQLPPLPETGQSWAPFWGAGLHQAVNTHFSDRLKDPLKS